MTQIVGIVCKESVIVASESQYTMGGWKHFDGKKMQVVTFRDNQRAIVAVAGAISPALRTIELMQELASKTALKNEEIGGLLAKQAIIKYRSETRRLFDDNSQVMATDQDDLFSRDNWCFELVMGYVFRVKGKPAVPCLYRICVADGNLERVHQFAVVGSSSQLATLILKPIAFSGFDFTEIIPLAIDVLEKTKKTDLYCGGEVQLAVVSPSFHVSASHVILMGNDQIKRITAKLLEYQDSSTLRQIGEFSDLMKQVHKEWVDEWTALQKDENQGNRN